MRKSGMARAVGSRNGSAARPTRARPVSREALIASTLDLYAAHPFDAVTVERIAASAHVPPAALLHHFQSPEAVVLAALGDVLHATVAALKRVGPQVEPTEALYLAASDMLTAVVAGRGVLTQARFVSMIDAIAASTDLGRRAAALRKTTLGRGLAAHLRMHPRDPVVLRAAKLWSAIMCGYYAGIRYTPVEYLPRDHPELHQHASLRLAEIFHDVMGRPAPAIR